jgi:glycosyltransferase involved in cell wall biosynthesis
MKKIKLLYNVCTSKYAGTEHQIYLLCKFLKNDFDITVVAEKDSILLEKLKLLNIRTVELNFKNVLRAIYCLVKIIDRYSIDIIHNHLGMADLIGTFAGKLKNVDVILSTKHFIHPDYTYRNIFSRYFALMAHKLVNRNNKMLIAVSEAVRQATIIREKVREDKIITIHNGSDLEVKDVKHINSNIIGTMSRLSPERGIQYLIKAMPDVLNEFPDAKCLIAGNGQYKSFLLDLIRNLNIDRSVRLVGYIDDIRSYYDNIDVFVSPAIEEAFGLAIVEAQLMGLPVVVASDGGPKEIILHNKTGLIVNSKDSKAIAKAIISLLKDKKLAKELAIAGQKRALDKYSASLTAESYKKLYKNLLGCEYP